VKTGERQGKTPWIKNRVFATFFPAFPQSTAPTATSAKKRLVYALFLKNMTGIF
jgi:hypothetical protein